MAVTGQADSSELRKTQPGEAIAALLTAEGRENRYALYETVRAHGDLVQAKPGLMIAVGYAECDAALRDIRLKAQDKRNYDQIYPEWRAHSSLRGYLTSMLYTNPPDHTRMRRLVSGAFSPRRVQSIAPTIRAATDRLLDRMADLGPDGKPVDFVAEFGSRLPIAVISALLGVPEDDEAWFRAMAADVTRALEGVATESRLGPADAAMDELSPYFLELVDRHRRHPADNVVGTLVEAHDADGDRLSRDELVGNMMLMLTAGFETTSFLLGHAVRLAIEDPGHASRLRGEPGFADGYVEEVLRFEPPVQATSRWAETAVEVLGTPVPADTKIVIVLAAGNRDPRRYPGPDRFDPDRPDIQPLSFGAGGHYCLGAPLSRLEAQIALPRLFRRFPRLAAAGDLIERDQWVGRGFDYFPVALR